MISIVPAFTGGAPAPRSRLWQSDPERRPALGNGLHFDLAIVQLNDPIDHRQSDAAAFFLRREIQIEDLLKMLRADADACIFDRDFHLSAGDRPTRKTQS